MGFRFDDESLDSLDAGRPASVGFSVERSAQARAAGGAAPRVGRGPAGAARGIRQPMAGGRGQRPGRGQPAPGRLPPAAAPGRAGQPGGVRGAIPGTDPGLSPGCWRRRRSAGRWAGESEGTGFPLRLPDTGDEVFGFRLGRPLGEGAFARVFLGEQADLAGRPVVLKVTDIEGSEPQTLAQLLHAHIVPIYSLHEDRRAACEPSACRTWAGRACRRCWPGSGPTRRVRSPASRSSGPWRPSRPRGRTRCGRRERRHIWANPTRMVLRRSRAIAVVPREAGRGSRGMVRWRLAESPSSALRAPSPRRGEGERRTTAPGGRGMAGGESDRPGPEGGGERVEGDGAVEAGGVPLIRPSGTFSPAGRRGGAHDSAGRKRHGGR